MLKEKIIESIFNNVFNHVVAPVLCQEKCKRSQVFIRQRFFVNIIEDLNCSGDKTGVKAGAKIFIKSMIQVVLQYFLSQVGTTSFISQYITQARAIFYDILAIIITGIGTC